MNPSIQLRAVLLLSAASFVAGCATEPQIDPANLPPQALVDDGVDYYSSTRKSGDPGTDGLLSYNSDQWTTDENGNRVYHLNRLPQGRTSSYYVGDIRYIYVNNTNGDRSGPGNSPAEVSRNGWPLHSNTLRGSNANTYYQTRRGRITYLPNRYSRPVPADTTQGTTQDDSTSTDRDSSTPTITTPAPTSRPVTTRAPRAPRRSAPPRVSRPKRSTRTTDGSRRPDK